MNKKTILIIAGVSVVVLAIGLGAGFFLFAGEDSAEAKAPPKPSIGLVDLETFLTNINDPNGKHHARLQLKVAVEPKEAAEAAKADVLLMARMRDQVLTLLTAKTFGELSQAEGKEVFRKEVAERLTPLMEEGEVKEVLFYDFVVQ